MALSDERGERLKFVKMKERKDMVVFFIWKRYRREMKERLE